MKRYLKYFLWIIGVLVSILVITNVVFYFYFNSHKQELLQKFNKNISAKLQGNFKISDMTYKFSANVSRFSISLDNVSLTDSLYAQHKLPTLQVEKINAALDLKSLLKKEIKIDNLNLENGQFNLFKLKNSYTNNYLLSPKKSKVTDKNESSGFDINLEKIKISNFSVHIFDQIKGHNYQGNVKSISGNLAQNDNEITIDSDLNFDVKELLFNAKNGAFLKNSALEASPKLVFNKKNKKLSWDATNFKIKDQNLSIGGYFSLDKIFTFQLNIINENTDFKTTSTLLADNIQKAISPYNIDGNFYVNGKIVGLQNQETYVKLDYKLPGNDLKTPWFNGENAKLQGRFLNQVNPNLGCTDENTELLFENIETEVEGIKVKSPYVKIMNIAAVYISMKAGAEGESKELNQILKNNKLSFGDGTFKLDFSMNGNLQRDLPAPNFDGYFQITDTDLLLTKTKEKKIKNNGKMVFKGSDLYLQNLKSVYENTNFIVNGSIKNIVPFLLFNQNSYALDLNLKGNSIKIEDFIHLIGYMSNPNARKPPTPIKTSTKDILENINNNPQKIRIDFNNISYRKLKANHLKANLLLQYPTLRCDNFSLDFTGGSIKLNSVLTNVSNNKFLVKSDINVKNVDFQSLLTSFNYFGIKSLETSRLKGRADLKTNMAFFMDTNSNISPNSMKGNLYFNIYNGSFHNFVPMGKVLTMVLSKERFDDVAFKTISNTVSIGNGNITIPRMEVQTSALNFYLEGNYSFGNQTDMMVSLPFSEFKKRKPDYVPPKVNFDEAGRKIYLKIKDGADGKSNFNVYFNQENAVNNSKTDTTTTKEDSKKSIKKKKFLKIFKGK